MATRCQILRLKCTKSNFGWGSAPGPAGGTYSASPGPVVGFKVPTSKGREEKGYEMGGQREGKGRKREGRKRRRGKGGEGKGRLPG